MGLHWLVTGSGGQLGSALIERLAARGAPFSARSHAELDIADADAVAECIAGQSKPLVVVNAAAFTRVDGCERDPRAAERGNALGPAVLAGACVRTGSQLVHVSTDYVFPGDAERPYRENDEPGPRSVYGRTKLEGEKAVTSASPGFLVVRTSWLFGRGRNFIVAVLDQASRVHSGEQTLPLRVVDDQRGRPTWAVDLASAIVHLVEVGASGVVHVANAGVATWWQLARLCLDVAGYTDVSVERVSTRALALPAPRPAWSVLDTRRARDLGVELQPWEDAARAYLRSKDSPLASRAEVPRV